MFVWRKQGRVVTATPPTRQPRLTALARQRDRLLDQHSRVRERAEYCDAPEVAISLRQRARDFLARALSFQLLIDRHTGRSRPCACCDKAATRCVSDGWLDAFCPAHARERFPHRCLMPTKVRDGHDSLAVSHDIQQRLREEAA